MISDIKALKLTYFTIKIGISGVPTPTFPSALNDFTAKDAESRLTPKIIVLCGFLYWFVEFVWWFDVFWVVN